MSITIRTAALSDAGGLCALMQELVENPPAPERLAQTLRELLADPNHLLLVADDGSRLLGTVTGVLGYDLCGVSERERRFLTVENVVTTADTRGKGIGRMLFDALEQWARNAGCGYALLVSSSFRTGAHAFYRKIGYRQECGFRKALW